MDFLITHHQLYIVRCARIIMRKKDFHRILESVLRVLSDYPNGLTLRELAKKTDIPLSTLRWYLDRDLAMFVHDQRIGPIEKPFARLITLRIGATKKASLKLQELLKEHS